MAQVGPACDVFEKGETVVIMDTGILSGLVKIRKPGDPQGFWTSIKVVD